MAVRKTVEEVCKSLAISPATYHRWQMQYGGADLDTVKECKAFKEENTRLKRLVASIPAACQGWANNKAAYRFLSNKRVTDRGTVFAAC